MVSHCGLDLYLLINRLKYLFLDIYWPRSCILPNFIVVFLFLKYVFVDFDMSMSIRCTEMHSLNSLLDFSSPIVFWS